MDSWSKMMEWKQVADKYMNQSFFPDHNQQQKQSPQVNIYESENELLCLVSLPGLNNVEDVEVYVYKSSIKLIGNTSLHTHGMSIKQDEIFQGRFERDVSLPYSVREDPIDAYYHKGVLYIRLYRLLTDDRPKKKVQIKDQGE
ncbi:Hsp20/alpha crystallin family protein [Pseudalkalibacillus berkeleyi]|uniref:Hsp20/alpha crystallin family protein n=1 Tax=Pseudalkalibacillus berkeleyi TaxID=1069813 RepID=A0ABS9H0A4_9BACL|nr:Hsp20/alpha crystallin family protein [Pseudalkalibacillus berkeleyi]MCF6137370.1 Hsp20/alpha crystallin family protein [Pseudalkalibacillus berkeleyi]